MLISKVFALFGLLKGASLLQLSILNYCNALFSDVGQLIQGIESTEENVLPETDADATFWDFQNKHIVNSRLASVKAMERFASDTSAFTTITDADSDSGDSSLEALPVILKTIIKTSNFNVVNSFPSLPYCNALSSIEVSHKH